MINNNQHAKRIRKIHFIYKYELLNEKINLTDAFENYNFNNKEIDELDTLISKYKILKGIIQKYFIKNWEWNRLSPLERSILLVGAFELNTLDKGIVINEMVIYSKNYLLEERYKFINAILQKVACEYSK